MRNCVRRVAAAGAMVIAATAATAWALELGEKAPEIDVTAWAQGEPIKIADGAGKTVFIVEFTSTFKPACAEALTAAAKLQDKYKAKGLELVAVTTETVDEVKKYLAEHATSGRFAIDENHNTLGAFDVPKDKEDAALLPFAVVVDKTGSIAFLGDPTRGMEKVVDDLIAGKFDLKKAVAVRALTKDLWSALRSRDHDKANELCDKIIEIDPADMYAFDRRAEGYRNKKDLDGYRKFTKSCVDRVKDDPKALSQIAWRLAGDGEWTWRDPDLAVAAIRRAVDATKSADADVLDTYAAVLESLGLIEQAIAQEKAAIAVDAKDEDYKKRLAYYEACLAAKQKEQPGKKK